MVGDNITYTPNAGQQGSDTCTVQVKDNENSTVNFVATWNGIDTIAPVTTDNANSTWRSTDMTVTLTANETSTTKYCKDTTNSCDPVNAGTVGTSVSVTCTAGTTCPAQYVRYYSTDTAGNAESVKS